VQRKGAESVTDPAGRGPDLVIAGAARSGTSTLAAHLSRHPAIDMGMVKEPNYFSRHIDLGDDWYDGLFTKRTPGLLRLDASTSYTYPQFPHALKRLAEAAPQAYVVYLVRDPLERAVSHYLYYRHYFKREPAATFADALRTGSYYTDVSDYDHWLPCLRQYFSEHLLVVPFDAVTNARTDVLSSIYSGIGIHAEPVAENEVEAHQNNVVEFRAKSVRLAVNAVRRNRTYMRLRSVVGPHRVRKIRSVLTRTTVLPSAREVIASCDDEQLAALRIFEARARTAVRDHLQQQDVRLGLAWTDYWTRSGSLTDGAPEQNRADT
jgi:Sulfotransferase family